MDHIERRDGHKALSSSSGPHTCLLIPAVHAAPLCVWWWGASLASFVYFSSLGTNCCCRADERRAHICISTIKSGYFLFPPWQLHSHVCPSAPQTVISNMSHQLPYGVLSLFYPSSKYLSSTYYMLILDGKSLEDIECVYIRLHVESRPSQHPTPLIDTFWWEDGVCAHGDKDKTNSAWLKSLWDHLKYCYH